MIKVAVVEDQPTFRELWTEILNNTDGYTCVGAFDKPADVLKKLPKLNADIVLMDIHLGSQRTGIDCVRILRQNCPTTQFLMFTVFQDDENIFEALKAGATGYILKNTTPANVIEAITELYNGGSPMSAAIARRVLVSFQNVYNDKVHHLMPREVEILELLAKGLFYKEIGDKLKLSIGAVKQNLHDIYKKLEVSNRTEAVNKFFSKH